MLTFGSFVTLGILNEAMVDILAMRGCGVIEAKLLICDNGLRAFEAIVKQKL